MNNKIKTRKKRLKLGDIYEIALPNNKNAYGRLYKEYTLAIYNKLCNNVEEIPEEENYKFFCGVYKNLLQDGEWKIVGNREFENEEDAWPPPTCVVDALTGKGSICYKGEIISSNYEECENLEIAATWDRKHLIDRLMGINLYEKNNFLGKSIGKLRHNKFQYGDIYEIPLPNGKNAYGRLYKMSILGVYEGMYDSVYEIPKEENYKFFCGVTTILLKDKELKIVGNREFENEEDAWPPPFCAINIIDNSCCIYYKEKFIKCDKKECHNLQVITFLNKEELINKLMLYI